MTEATEQIIIRKSPLEAMHDSLGATMAERDGWNVPASYGDAASEYAAVRQGGEGGKGLIDLSPRGRIVVSGSEAVQFLNGLITNDMKTLAENSWMPAAFPNVQGRLIASVRVTRLEEAATDKNVPTYLIDTEAATHERVLKTVERFTLAGDFHVRDITSETAQLTLQGKRAGEVMRATLADEVASLARNEAKRIGWRGTQITVMRATHTGEDGFDVVVDSKHASALWDALLAGGAKPVGYDAFETLRIEAGIPRFGTDMDETNVVTETNLDDAVSYTKGCYVGQEIIARIKYRGHVAKKLTGISFEKAAQAEAGAPITSTEGKEVGRITSVTFSPHLRRTVALGYLKYDYLEPGTVVKVAANDEDLSAIVIEGRVTELPFVRGSWHAE